MALVAESAFMEGCKERCMMTRRSICEANSQWFLGRCIPQFTTARVKKYVIVYPPLSGRSLNPSESNSKIKCSKQNLPVRKARGGISVTEDDSANTDGGGCGETLYGSNMLGSFVVPTQRLFCNSSVFSRASNILDREEGFYTIYLLRITRVVSCSCPFASGTSADDDDTFSLIINLADTGNNIIMLTVNDVWAEVSFQLSMTGR